MTDFTNEATKSLMPGPNQMLIFITTVPHDHIDTALGAVHPDTIARRLLTTLDVTFTSIKVSIPSLRHTQSHTTSYTKWHSRSALMVGHRRATPLLGHSHCRTWLLNPSSSPRYSPPSRHPPLNNSSNSRHPSRSSISSWSRLPPI